MSTSAPAKLQGFTQALASGVNSVPNAIQVKTIDGIGANNYVMSNLGPDIAFVGYGPDPATAQANSVIPAPGTPVFCVVLFPGMQSFSLPPNSYFSAVSRSVSSKVLIQPGDGTARGGQIPTIDQASAQAQISYQLNLIYEQLALILNELMVQSMMQNSAFGISDDLDSLRGDPALPPQPQ